MKNPSPIIITGVIWAALLTCTQVGYQWAENIAVFGVWLLMVMVVLIFIALPQQLKVHGENIVNLTAPFHNYTYGIMGAVTLFFVARGQFWTAGAGVALLFFMAGIDNTIKVWRKNVTVSNKSGERGH